MFGYDGLDTYRLSGGHDTIGISDSDGPVLGTEQVFGWGANDTINATALDDLDSLDQVSVEHVAGGTRVFYIDAGTGEGFDLLLVGRDLDRAEVIDQILI